MKFKPYILSLLLLTSCMGQKTEKTSLSASGASGSGSNLTTRWPATKLPLAVKISTDFNTSTIDSYDETSGNDSIQQMMKLWNTAYDAGTLYNFNAGYIANYEPALADSYNDSTVGIYLLSSWPSDFKAEALAVTQYWAQEIFSPTGNYYEIIHGDILVNYEYYNYSAAASGYTFKYDFPTVILHELGHLAGLKHVSKSLAPSIMLSTLGTDEVKRQVYTIDKELINSIYEDSALTAKDPVLGKFSKSEESPQKRGNVYRGVIELMPSGKCLHYLNGELVEEH